MYTQYFQKYFLMIVGKYNIREHLLKMKFIHENMVSIISAIEI